MTGNSFVFPCVRKHFLNKVNLLDRQSDVTEREIPHCKNTRVVFTRTSVVYTKIRVHTCMVPPTSLFSCVCNMLFVVILSVLELLKRVVSSLTRIITHQQ